MQQGRDYDHHVIMEMTEPRACFGKPHDNADDVPFLRDL